MKTLRENQTWDANFKSLPKKVETDPRPKIGDDDGISNKAMNTIILLFMLLTVGVTIATAAPSDNVKYRILLRQAMLDMDRMEYDKAITKLLEVRSNTEANANVDHMIGLCYLYGEHAPEKAVYYLNRAAEHASPQYEEWDLDEVRAPIETAYHLAKAYETIEDFANASVYYKQYLEALEGSEMTISERTYAIINKNAEDCRIASVGQPKSEIKENVVFNK